MRAVGWGILVVLSVTPALAHAGGERFIGSVSTARLAAPGRDSNLVHFGTGGALSILWLEDGAGSLCAGIDTSALFLRGDGDDRLYDLSVGLTGSLPLDSGPISPFLAVGLDMVSAAIAERDGTVSRGVGLGVHGDLGLHALLGEHFYARGQIGYLGAAVGGVKGEVGIGYRFE